MPQVHLFSTTAGSPTDDIARPRLSAAAGADAYRGPIFGICRLEQDHSASAGMHFLPALTAKNGLSTPVDILISRLLPQIESRPTHSDKPHVSHVRIQPGGWALLPATRDLGETISWRISQETCDSPEEPPPPVSLAGSAGIAASAQSSGVRAGSSVGQADGGIQGSRPPMPPMWSTPMRTSVAGAPSRMAQPDFMRPSASQQARIAQPTASLPAPGACSTLDMYLPQSLASLPWLHEDAGTPSSRVGSIPRGSLTSHTTPLEEKRISCLLVCSQDIHAPDPMTPAQQPPGAQTTQAQAGSASHPLSPCTLTLLPHAAVVNDSPWWVRVEVPGGSTPGPWVGPGQGLPLDWHPLRFRPRKVALAVALGPAVTSQEPDRSLAARPGPLATPLQPPTQRPPAMRSLAGPQILRCQAFKVTCRLECSCMSCRVYAHMHGIAGDGNTSADSCLGVCWRRVPSLLLPRLLVQVKDGLEEILAVLAVQRCQSPGSLSPQQRLCS